MPKRLKPINPDDVFMLRLRKSGTNLKTFWGNREKTTWRCRTQLCWMNPRWSLFQPIKATTCPSSMGPTPRWSPKQSQTYQLTKSGLWWSSRPLSSGQVMSNQKYQWQPMHVTSVDARTISKSLTTTISLLISACLKNVWRTKSMENYHSCRDTPNSDLIKS